MWPRMSLWSAASDVGGVDLEGEALRLALCGGAVWAESKVARSWSASAMADSCEAFLHRVFPAHVRCRGVGVAFISIV